MYHARRTVSASFAVPPAPAWLVPPASSAREREAVQLETAGTRVAGGGRGQEGGGWEEDDFSLTKITSMFTKSHNAAVQQLIRQKVSGLYIASELEN